MSRFESEQLPGQSRRPVAVVLDLLDIIIIAVARRMAQQHQVAMANDRGQDIVEIMRHPAGQLANRLHLGCLRHLAFQFRFLAIVADREQHRSLAQSADPRDPQSDRFLAAAAQPHRQIQCRLFWQKPH